MLRSLEEFMIRERRWHNLTQQGESVNIKLVTKISVSGFDINTGLICLLFTFNTIVCHARVKT